MSQLDTYHDRVIAFEAVRTLEVPSRIAAQRQPLQPSKHQVPQNPLLPKPEIPACPGSKALYIPMLDDVISKYGLPGENAVPTPQSNARLSPHYQSPYSKGGSQPSQNRMQSPCSSMRSPPGSTRPSPINPDADSVAPSSRNIVSNSMQEASRVPQSFSPSSRGNVFNNYTGIPVTESETKKRAPAPFDTRAPLDTKALGKENWKIEPAVLKSEVTLEDGRSTDEVPIYSAEAEMPTQQFFQLHALLRDAPPDMLERGVEQGVKLLEDLRTPLVGKVESSPDAAQWIQQIDTLRRQAVKTRTIIGVVGNTGAGKSSVINAMLDEERLVPTNCMRACTAVVTEISYNHSEVPYRAEVEFITPADWGKELKTLFDDLLDGEGKVSRDCSNQDTDAGIAYAKIKAVYPKKTKEDIANSSIQKMLQEVSYILGQSKEIEETDSLRFYKRLQRFVDSKEKSTGEKDKDKKKESKEMEFWPLIRVVK